MITYKNIIDDFNTIATNHFLINSFHSGMLDEVDINKLDQSDFPILYVEPGNTNIEMLQIMQDIIAEFRQNLAVQTANDPGKKFSYVPGEVVLNLPINAEPFTVRFSNMLTGWSASFTMQVNNPNSLCNAPIEPSDEDRNT